MTLRLGPERDLAALRLIITGWTRAEYHGRGGNRVAQQLAIMDMKELWRVELVGWGAETGGDSSGAV